MQLQASYQLASTGLQAWLGRNHLPGSLPPLVEALSLATWASPFHRGCLRSLKKHLK